MSHQVKLPPLPNVREVLNIYGISAMKNLSQNFILDMTLASTIVKQAGNLDGCHVVEIGPGLGSLTRAILEQNIHHLDVVEIDKRLLPGLKVLEKRSQCMTIHHKDCLQFPMDNLFPEEYVMPWDDKKPKIHIIGNLPFGVSIPLIVQYLSAISKRSGAWRYGRVPMTITLSDTVGHKVCSIPKSRDRGRLAFDIQNLCHVTMKRRISGSAFVPKAKSDVALLTFTPRKKPVVDLPFDLTCKVSKELFHLKKKFVSTNIKGLFPYDKQCLTKQLLDASKIFPRERPINLTNEEIGRICIAYSKMCKRFPYLLKYDNRNAESIYHSSVVAKVEKELGFVDAFSDSGDRNGEDLNDELLEEDWEEGTFRLDENS